MTDNAKVPPYYVDAYIPSNKPDPLLGLEYNSLQYPYFIKSSDHTAHFHIDVDVVGGDEDEMDEVHYKSNCNDWNTPLHIFDWLAPLGQVSLDPCSNYYSIVPASVRWEKDGLESNWNVGEGYVFVNPPYAREIGKWTQKGITEYSDHNVEIVYLAPARTDTRWFNQLMGVASAACFIKGRLTFNQYGKESITKAPFPSALIYLGKRPFLFCEALEHKGWVIAQ